MGNEKSFFGMVLLMFMGCSASHDFQVSKAPSRSFEDFGQVDIQRFSVDMSKYSTLDPDDQKKIQGIPPDLQAQLIKKMEKAKLFQKGTGGRLLITGQLGEYDPGDRTARWLVGFGAGEGHITATVSFADASGNVFCCGTAAGRVQFGLAGGSMSSAVDELSEAIIRFLQTSLGERPSSDPRHK